MTWPETSDPPQCRILASGGSGGLTQTVSASTSPTARAVVVPAVWVEPYGRTAAEALGYGRPVITTGTGGLAEIVDDASGWITGVSVDAVASAIRQAASSDDAVARRGAATLGRGTRRCSALRQRPPRSSASTRARSRRPPVAGPRRRVAGPGRGETGPVRVLVVHNRYSSRVPSGENLCVQDEVSWLREAGVDVHTHLVSNDTIGDQSGLAKFRQAAELPWSRAAGHRLRAQVERLRPDVVHVHNLFPLLTASAPWNALRAGVPVVWSCHNRRVVCVEGTNFRDGLPCRLCRPGWRVPGVRYGCYQRLAVGRGEIGRPAATAASALVTVSSGAFRTIAAPADPRRRYRRERAELARRRRAISGRAGSREVQRRGRPA